MLLGSAIEWQGKHYLMYTSNREDKLPDGTLQIRQTQSMAVGNGRDYEKFPENPVITADTLPEGSSLSDFRDPKFWREDDGFYAVIGSRSPDGQRTDSPIQLTGPEKLALCEHTGPLQ